MLALCQTYLYNTSVLCQTKDIRQINKKALYHITKADKKVK